MNTVFRLCITVQSAWLSVQSNGWHYTKRYKALITRNDTLEESIPAIPLKTWFCHFCILFIGFFLYHFVFYLLINLKQLREGDHFENGKTSLDGIGWRVNTCTEADPDLHSTRKSVQFSFLPPVSPKVRLRKFHSTFCQIPPLQFGSAAVWLHDFILIMVRCRVSKNYTNIIRHLTKTWSSRLLSFIIPGAWGRPYGCLS